MKKGRPAPLREAAPAGRLKRDGFGLRLSSRFSFFVWAKSLENRRPLVRDCASGPPEGFFGFADDVAPGKPDVVQVAI
jgi:hypothetical protein